MNWSIADSEVAEGDPAVTLELKDDSYSRSMWDFSFQALYKVNSATVMCGLMLYAHTDNSSQQKLQLCPLQHMGLSICFFF